MLPYLKVKIKSLASEARIIRLEEKRWPGNSSQRSGLHHHRTYDVRREQRAALLAYGFLRGKPHNKVESPYSRPVNWSRVAELVKKFGAEHRSTKKEDVIKQLIAWAEADFKDKAA